MFSKWDLYKKINQNFISKFCVGNEEKSSDSIKTNLARYPKTDANNKIDLFRVNDPVHFDVSICLRSGFYNLENISFKISSTLRNKCSLDDFFLKILNSIFIRKCGLQRSHRSY